MGHCEAVTVPMTAAFRPHLPVRTQLYGSNSWDFEDSLQGYRSSQSGAALVGRLAACL